jgi:hypothetical protein
VSTPLAELQALAGEVLGRGKDALDAVARRDRFAVNRLGEALAVAMELALTLAPQEAPVPAVRVALHQSGDQS